MSKRNLIVIAVGVVLAALLFALPTLAQYQTKIYFDTGGDRMVVAPTGQIVIQGGGALVVTPGAAVNALYYASSGKQIVCGSATVTDTATIATGMTSNTYCWSNLNQAANGDARTTNCRTSSGNAIVDVKNSALTPVANATGAAVVWCAVGTP